METNQPIFELKGSEGNLVRITPFKFIPPEGPGLGFTEDSVQSHIEIQFKNDTEAKFEARLLTGDFKKLKDFFEALKTNPLAKEKFWFSNTDEYLKLEAEGDGLGHFKMICEANNVSYANLHMSFELNFDQTQIAPLIHVLETMVKKFSN